MGGQVYSINADLTLDRVVIRDIPNGVHAGAGVEVTSSMVHVSNSLITNNKVNGLLSLTQPTPFSKTARFLVIHRAAGLVWRSTTRGQHNERNRLHDLSGNSVE